MEREEDRTLTMEEWRVRPTEGAGGAAGLSVINSYTL